MNCEIILPAGASTTLKGTSGRLIDFLLVSRPIVALLKSLEVDYDIPTTPHFALKLVLYAKPRTFTEPILVHPRPLPIDAFTIAWKELGADARRLFFSEAAIMASERLALQKGRTGMAILGRPLAEVANTLAEHLSDSISSGEAFAQASLTSELLVCLVTKVSRDDFHF